MKKSKSKIILSLSILFSLVLSFLSLAILQGAEGKSKSKILVIFYSRTGNTKRVAQDLAAKLNADTEEIIDKRDRKGFINWFKAGRDAMKKYLTEINAIKKNPKNYNLILIGTPIWAGDMTPAVRTYMTQFKNDFKNVAFFLTAGSSKFDKTFMSMEELSGKKPVATLGFSSQDLKNKEIYENKLKQFVDELKK